MNISNLITLCIITNTCRGRQRPGDVYACDVSLYSVIKQRLNPPYFIFGHMQTQKLLLWNRDVQ